MSRPYQNSTVCPTLTLGKMYYKGTPTKSFSVTTQICTVNQTQKQGRNYLGSRLNKPNSIKTVYL